MPTKIKHAPYSENGFSLVEMSVVLAIVALLLGGVLTGKSMIRSADVQGTLAKAEQYTAAIGKFRDRFYSLPGDMPNATTMWGNASTGNCISPSGNTAGDSMPAGTGTQTCNGNGDGRIGGTNIGASGCMGNVWETYRMWQHLSNAELVKGTYTGISTNAGTDAAFTTVGTNVPEALLTGGGYSVIFCNTLSGATSFYNGTYGHTMFIGSATANSPHGFTQYGLFTPGEAGQIDKKLDDSYADTGRILGIQADDTTSPGCTINANAAPVSGGSDYNYANNERVCPLIMKLGF